MNYLEAISWLVKHRVPYEDWPEELQIAGVTEDLMGKEVFECKADLQEDLCTNTPVWDIFQNKRMNTIK